MPLIVPQLYKPETLMKLPFGVLLTILGIVGVADGVPIHGQSEGGMFVPLQALIGALVLVSGLLVVAKRDRLLRPDPKLPRPDPDPADARSLRPGSQDTYDPSLPIKA